MDMDMDTATANVRRLLVGREGPLLRARAQAPFWSAGSLSDVLGTCDARETIANYPPDRRHVCWEVIFSIFFYTRPSHYLNTTQDRCTHICLDRKYLKAHTNTYFMPAWTSHLLHVPNKIVQFFTDVVLHSPIGMPTIYINHYSTHQVCTLCCR